MHVHVLVLVRVRIRTHVLVRVRCVSKKLVCAHGTTFSPLIELKVESTMRPVESIPGEKTTDTEEEESTPDEKMPDTEEDENDESSGDLPPSTH